MMPSKLDAAAALETMDSMDAAQTLPPAFDFSALGELSALASEADRQFDLHYGTAQDEYLISCIYLAKVHELTAKAGRYGGGTWTKWYESKGLSEGSARTMVKNGDAFKSATVAELKQLPDLTRKDLNLIARSGCADQLVESAGNSQKVQALIDRLRADVVSATNRADAAEAERDKLLGAQNRATWAEIHIQEVEAQRDAAIADVNGLKERATAAEAREEEAWKMREKAEARAKDAENQLAGSRQVAEAARLRGDKLKAENDALKQQPITAVVDREEVQRQAKKLFADMADEEVDRRATEKAWGIADARNRELAAEKEQLQKELDTLRKSSAQLERRMKTMTHQMDDLGQTDFETANHCPAAMLAIWNSCKGSYSRLTGEDLESTFLYICNTLNSIRQEAALLCRQPEGYDGGDA